jgi:hypothetical protein
VLGAAFRPCGGLSRSDRTPATCMSYFNIHAQGGGRGLSPIQQTESGACLAHPAELTMQQKGVHSVSMQTTAAIQRGLFGEDFEVDAEPVSEGGWRERAQRLMETSQRNGGLVPQRALPDVLGLSRQRVHELVLSGQFEVVKFEGIPFVTGRSIDAWEQDADKSKGGWRARRGTVWQRVAASVAIGSEVGKAVA